MLSQFLFVAPACQLACLVLVVCLQNNTQSSRHQSACVRGFIIYSREWTL